MALGDNVILGWAGPGGGTKIAMGTAVVGDTVQTRLTRVFAVFLSMLGTPSASDECMAATGLNTTSGVGSFLVDGEAGDSVAWVALGV